MFTVRALDLTPNPSFKELEGIKIPVVQFNDETTKINYRPPPNWKLSGGGNTLHLYPPGESHAWMKLILADKQTESVAPEALQATARQFLPQGFTNLVLAKLVPNPFTLNGHATYELIFTYSLFGSQDVASISLADRSDKKWLVLVVSASARDFDPIHAQAISSMFTWTKAP